MAVRFSHFHADFADERLWHGSTTVHLTRKAWGVLRVLIEANGRLVTKDQLAHAVWHGTHVGDDSLTKVVGEIRRALGDDQRAPRFIATVHGRGYRFLAAIRDGAESSASPSPVPWPSMIGREAELALLRSWMAAVREGARQMGFLTGEVGIGKSSLLAAFLDDAARHGPVHIAAGECVEQFGEADPFLPVISALRRLCRVSAAEAIVRHAAPPWLAAACGIAPPLASAGPGAMTRAGVLRTLAEVVEAVANQVPLILVLEDLHWSDPSTLDLVNLLARRADPARLLVLGTLRASDALAAGHPSARLVRELCRIERCREIVLEGLSLAAIGEVLRERIAGEPPAGAAAYLLRQTGGNPFFLGALLDDLLARQSLRYEGERWQLDVETTPAVPAGSLAALAPRLARLSSTERAMLEVASVVGDSFSPAIVGTVMTGEGAADASLDAVEAVCERLVRHSDILCGTEGETPYAFRHALYRRAVYEGITPARQRRLHRRVGESQAATRPPGSRAGATELAEHFACAGEHAAAARHHAEAAEMARARLADREVAAHLGAALAHLRQCPPAPERDAEELMLVQQHAAAMLAAKGFGDGEVAEAYRRAQALALSLEIPLAHFMATAGLLFYHLMRAELDAAAKLADEMTAAARHLPLAECAAAARAATGAVLFSRGELVEARRHLDGLHGLFQRRDASVSLDASVWYLGILALTYTALGETDGARAICAELLACAAGGSPFDLAIGHTLVAGVETQLQNPPAALEHADAASAIAADCDSPLLVSSVGQLRGWAIAAMGDAAAGLAISAEGEAAWRSSGQRLGLPSFAVLRAEACLYGDDPAGAEAAIQAGLEHAEATGERRQDSDLYRLRAACLRRRGRIDEAAACLDIALAIAADQGARLAELRAANDRTALYGSTDARAAAAGRG